MGEGDPKLKSEDAAKTMPPRAILPEQLEASSPYSRSNAEIGYRMLDWQFENPPQGDPEEQIII
jgi:hypothetical protein